jgi:hypothetical protein
MVGCIGGRMDGWLDVMDGWMEGCNGWMDGWMNRQTDRPTGKVGR